MGWVAAKNWGRQGRLLGRCSCRCLKGEEVVRGRQRGGRRASGLGRGGRGLKSAGGRVFGVQKERGKGKGWWMRWK